jgi:hypothetical protein
MHRMLVKMVLLLAVGASVQDFEKRIADYGRLRHTAEAHLPRLKPTDSPDAIAKHEHVLAQAIREARAEARQGDIFAPEIAAEFRRLLIDAMQGFRAARVEKSLQHAEPVRLALHINESYPAGVPLQSTPPTILSSLPKLPKELQYRIVGRDLVLLDVEANLVIDFIPGGVPG